jgi:hypothetical protein
MVKSVTVKTSMALIAIGLLASIIFVGARTTQNAITLQATEQPKVNEITRLSPTVESRVVAKHTVEYIEKPVAEIRYVERVQRLPVQIHNFTSLEDLERWMDAQKTTTTVHFQSPDKVLDCDDYALELQQKALADGYLISIELIGTGEYNSVFNNSELPANTLHAINLVIIGNGAYYIEPQTDEVVLAAHLD